MLSFKENTRDERVAVGLKVSATWILSTLFFSAQPTDDLILIIVIVLTFIKSQTQTRAFGELRARV